jgi:Domain of Unknown Function (DUF1080)
MTHLIAFVMVTGSIVATPQADDWTVLLGEKNLGAWKNPSKDWIVAGDVMLDADNPKLLKATPGTGVFVNGPKGRLPDLLTKEDYSDIEVHLEFNIPKGSNSGIKFCGLYEIQILDSFGVKKLKGSDCGGIYPKAELKPKYKYLDDGVPPRTNACKPPGQWQTLDAIFVAPRFGGDGKKIANARLVKAVLNGELIHEDVELLHATGSNWGKPEVAKGPILLQADHGPVAFRDVRVRPYPAKAQGQKKADPKVSEKVLSAVLELEQLLHDGYGPTHPKVKALQLQIDRLRTAGERLDLQKGSEKLLSVVSEMEQLLDSGYGRDHPKVKTLQLRIDQLRKAEAKLEVQTSSEKLLSAVLEWERLLHDGYGEDHPKRKALKRQIDRLRAEGVKIDLDQGAEKLLSAMLELALSSHEGLGPKHPKVVLLQRYIEVLRAEDVRIDRQRAREELEKLVSLAAELQDRLGDGHPEVRATYALVAFLANVLAKPEK